MNSPEATVASSQNVARKAAQNLLALVDDFPFLRSVDRVAWLAGLLTVVGRREIAGPVPFFLLEGGRGNGKGLLTNVVAAIATGQPMLKLNQARTEPELRRAAASVAKSGSPCVNIDNITSPLGRVPVDLPLVCWGTTTGVHCGSYAKGSDMARRTLVIRLRDAPRSGSAAKVQDRLAYAQENRLDLLAYAQAILDWHQFSHTAPVHLLPAWGSFEQWTERVRGALVWAGLADPAPQSATTRPRPHSRAAATEAGAEEIPF